MLTTNARMIRGYAIIAKGDDPQKVGKDEYKIPSQSGEGHYLVKKGYRVWSCTCPDHTFRNVDCKHINAVRFWLKLKDKLVEEVKERLIFRTEKTETKCPYCSSMGIVRDGVRKNKGDPKQVFFCKECKKRFSINEGFKYMKNDQKIITLSLDLYFKGVSQNGITDHIKQFYGAKVSQPTIHRWIKKYTNIINDYVKTLTPDVSGMWAIDEMMLKCNGEWNWLWNLMDTDTRFLISSMISEGKTRDVDTARIPLEEAKKMTGRIPDVIISDGLPAYERAVEKGFKKKTTHVRDIAITDTEHNNNKIERLHGTVRDRNKVQRGLKELIPSKTFVEGFKTYYNFIRPHQALNGKTPAEQAGIDLGLKGDRWAGIIKQSVKEMKK
jgi:transposase-like protein